MSKWKAIENYEGLYMISDNGEILSLQRQVATTNGHRTVNLRRLKPVVSHGYHTICLCKNGVKKREYIHRLVLKTFKSDGDNLHVNHINGVKSDNRVENLEWVTRSQNMKHAYASGLRNPFIPKGEKHGMAKLKEDDVLWIRNWEGYWSQKAMAKMFRVTQATISGIICKKTWK